MSFFWKCVKRTLADSKTFLAFIKFWAQVQFEIIFEQKCKFQTWKAKLTSLRTHLKKNFLNCLKIGLKRAFTRFWSCDLDGAYYASHFNREPVFPEKNLLIHTFGIRAKRAKRATNPCLMLTCHGLCRYTTDIRNNYCGGRFCRARPWGMSIALLSSFS